MSDERLATRLRPKLRRGKAEGHPAALRVCPYLRLFGWFLAVLLLTGFCLAATPVERGITLYREGKFTEAVAYLSALLEGKGVRGPDKIQALLHLGCSYLAVGDMGKETAAFSDLVRYAPSFHPDPVLFPPKVVDAFARGRAPRVGRVGGSGGPPGGRG